MIARRHLDRHGRQLSRALAVGLVALSVGAGALAPTVASAAATGAAPRAEARPDLTASPAYQGVLGPGQRAVLPVVVENKGHAVRGPVALKIMIAQGFADVSIRGAFGQAWACGGAVVGKYSGIATVTCTTDGLEADSHKAVLVTGTANELSDVWMVAVADPDDRIREADETNNRGKQNLGPYPVHAPEYLES